MKDPAILLLAAGESRRLGQPKQLLQIGGGFLIEKMTGIALQSGCANVVVALGAHATHIQPVLSHLPVTVAIHKGWAKGMGSSLAFGLRFLLKKFPDTEAIIVMLCDQPLVTADLLKKLIEKFLAYERPIVAADYGQALGPPVLFQRQFFAELTLLDGAQGAKKLLDAYAPLVAAIPFPEGNTDLDTPEDVQRFLSSL